MNGNLALLTGEVAGVLTSRGYEVEIPRDSDGNYTNTIKLKRPSGVYFVTVGMLEPNERALD